MEVLDVLSRDYIRERFKTLTDETVAAFIERMRKASELVRIVPKRFDYQERDVKDEPYVNLAIEAQADYLVSRDNDLLDLMRWDTETGRDFQRQYRHLKILDPVAFLNEIESHGAMEKD